MSDPNEQQHEGDSSLIGIGVLIVIAVVVARAPVK